MLSPFDVFRKAKALSMGKRLFSFRKGSLTKTRSLYEWGLAERVGMISFLISFCGPALFYHGIWGLDFLSDRWYHISYRQMGRSRDEREK
jgi:hypothetical protein